MGGFVGRRRPRSRIHAGKGVSAARKGGERRSNQRAVLVPEQSRTKDDHDDEDDFGRGECQRANILVLISCSS
jgi:hypothetical protein